MFDVREITTHKLHHVYDVKTSKKEIYGSTKIPLESIEIIEFLIFDNGHWSYKDSVKFVSLEFYKSSDMHKSLDNTYTPH